MYEAYTAQKTGLLYWLTYEIGALLVVDKNIPKDELWLIGPYSNEPVTKLKNIKFDSKTCSVTYDLFLKEPLKHVDLKMLPDEEGKK